MKILLYDLEVSRAIVEGYWNRYEFSVVKTVRPQILMCYAYKWLGDKRIYFKTIHDYDTYKEFVDSLRTVLDDCDVAIGHNLKQFDDKMSNRFIIGEGLDPPSPYIQIDTLQIARQNFKFQSNRLGELGQSLGLGDKEKITYADLEDDFLNNPTWSVLKKMEKYNKRDVELLEKVYIKLRPWMKNHPNLAVMGDAEACPVCQSKNVSYNGLRYTNTSVYRRAMCKDCRAPFKGRMIEKELQNRPEFVK